MAKFRPVDLRLWNDRKFLALSQDGRMLWLFLLTAPCTLPIPGVVVAGDASLAEQLGWTVERLRERFRELFQVGLSVQREGRVVWLKNALRYQPPANPNMVKSWAKSWDDVPECDLKIEIWQALKIACKSWSKLFEKGFAEPSRNGSANGYGNGSANGYGNRYAQDQDQDQDQEGEEGEDLPLPKQPPISEIPRAPDQSLEPELRRTAEQVTAHGKLRTATWERLNALRQQIAIELGVELRPLHPMDPGERALGMRIRESSSPERAAADIDHVLEVAATEARASGSGQWLTSAMFEERSWRRALGMSLEDAARPRERKGPRAAATDEPRRIKTL